MDAGAADGTRPQLLPPATNRRWLFAKHILITVIMLFSTDATYRAHRQRVPPLALQQEQGLQGRGQPGRGGQGWLLPLPLRSLQTPAHGDLSKGKASDGDLGFSDLSCVYVNSAVKVQASL